MKTSYPVLTIDHWKEEEIDENTCEHNSIVLFKGSMGYQVYRCFKCMKAMVITPKEL